MGCFHYARDPPQTRRWVQRRLLGVSPRVRKKWQPGAHTQGSVWAQKLGAKAGQNARPSAVALCR